MKLTSLFIDRPVLSIVLNFTIILFGLITASLLGVRDYPAVDPPVITVSTIYTGADADVVEDKITEPLEQSINGISGIKTLTSSSSDGRSRISVEFNLGTDLDKVSRAMRNLPEDADNPTVSKADANAEPILFITVESTKRTPIQLTDFARDVLIDQLQTIPGVSEAQIWGEKKRAMRLWMDPFKMAARNVTPLDVKNALDRENVILPAGQLEGSTNVFTIRTSGAISTFDEFNNLIIGEQNGTITRFSDIGEALEGAENERNIMKRNGVPMVGIALIPQAGSNTIAITSDFYKRLKELKKRLPADVKLGIGFDTTTFVKASIKEVIETLLISFCLVVFVIFAFLRNWRATLIPIVAMPISLIGTFFIMYIFGFSINILTLLGIVLATGLVVDDAIVVLENIYQKIESGSKPREAGHKGASEIIFAIISTTLSLMSVMLPIVIMSGMTGRLFREFGVVVAGAVAISAFVSLSLTPMLCSRILKHHDSHEKSLYGRTEPFFLAMLNAYRNVLMFCLDRRWIAFVVITSALAMIVLFYSILPKELAPMEDRSRFSISLTGPEGASFEYTKNAADKISDLIDKEIPEKDALIAVIPGMGNGGVNTANFRLMLSPPDERKRTQMELATSLTRSFSRSTDVRATVSQEQTIGDKRAGLPVQFVITAPTVDDLKKTIPAFLQETANDPVFSTSDVNMKFSKPQLEISIDREKARDLGLSVLDIAQSLQLALSGSRYGYYITNGKQYQIIGQFNQKDRSKPLDLTSFNVRNKDGKFISLDNVINLSESGSPPQIYHFNRSISATVSAGLAPGKTISDGIIEMQKIAEKILPENQGTALSGPARDFMESSSNLLITFLFALVLVYLVLAAQFESFRHPFIIMFTVPLALAGALFSLWYFNQSLNIFSQIGIIMLIGLVTKNGILIVEFANQRRIQGQPLIEALIEASVSRFRPIVMTSLTVVLGSLPIALSLGASAQSRVSLGIVVIGGLLFSLALSLFVVPIIYTFLAGESSNKAEALSAQNIPNTPTSPLTYFEKGTKG
jgi:multidrug efflux pump